MTVSRFTGNAISTVCLVALAISFLTNVTWLFLIGLVALIANESGI